MAASVLTLNAGSSSMKFALFELTGEEPAEAFRGQIEGLGGNAVFSVKFASAKAQAALAPRQTAADTHVSALREILSFVQEFGEDHEIGAIGHRVVHGGTSFSAPAIVDALVLETLHGLIPLAPLHQSHNIECIEASQTVFPNAAQIACFDTAFHRTHAWVNDTFGLPSEYYDAGVRRYGFHGLSYEHVCRELGKIAPELAQKRVIMAHLGNGASMCAMNAGKSISSTMSFTPLDGLLMGTRCGQLDAGVVLYLLEQRGMPLEAVSTLLHRGSGLKGMSRISHDIRDIELGDTPEGRNALDYFVHRARCELGALTATLCGLDALVFSGGIGEHAATIRKRICENFDWLGLMLDEEKNQKADQVLSADHSRVRVYIVPANEELSIARHVQALWAA
jgi:acetate kinase